MVSNYKYTLERGSKKHYCPSCRQKTFVRYIDKEAGNYLPDDFGRCDRESKCSYHLNPYLNGYAKMIWEQEERVTRVTAVKQKYFLSQSKTRQVSKVVFFDFEALYQTLYTKHYEKNVFIQNLFYSVNFPFRVDDVTKVIQLYRLGTVTNGYMTGATTFPFIDKEGNVRAIQVKQFDGQNHTTRTNFLNSLIEKRYQELKTPLPEWLKKYNEQEKKITCLFGEHLLQKYPNNPIALVEAPKTAIYGTLYFGAPSTPESFVWIAVYNKSSFSFDKLQVLKGRFVYVFPDLSKDGNTFKEWETKAKDYESRLPGTRFIFSDLLERLAPERDKNNGNDLADFLIKQDWRLFRKQDIQKPVAQTEKVTLVTKVSPKKNILFSNIAPSRIEKLKIERIEQPVREQPQIWNNDIAELENYFAGIEIPTEPVKLNNYSTITDCSLFIESHFTTLKANNGKRAFLTCLNRLQELKQVLTTNFN